MRKIIGLAVVIIFVLVVLGLVKQIYEALQISGRLDSAAETYNKLQAQNRQLKHQLGDVQKDTYIEQQARNKLNMARPGETVVVIPQEEIERLAKQYQPTPVVQVPNYQRWLKLIFD